MTHRPAFALAALATLTAQSQPAAPVRTTDAGRVEGIALAHGIDAFLGVPFAAPPVRGLRWQAPQPRARWTGTYHADRFAPECLQPLRSSRQNHYFGEEATSEDCLYLNVWAPRAATKAPVVVWIYGGGFTIGSASMANYSGEPLARAGVVRVNLAYRVGALGFLAHPALSREQQGRSGNYGLMDLIAGLRWVRRNIARFGGDPDNVTIVGQSAGSMSIALMQMSPKARGLFRRAVGMSGSPFGGMLGPATLASGEKQGVELAAALDATSLDALRAVPGDRIVAAQGGRVSIVRDGRIVTGPAEAVFAGQRQNDVPVLIGYTRDESFRPFDRITDRPSLVAAVRERYGARADAILTAYDSGDAVRDATDIARDASVGTQMAAWAGYQARYGTAPAYAYLFTRRQPYAPGIAFSDHDPATVGAYHTGDVPYWLRTRDALNLLRRTRIWEPGDVGLEREMSDALLSFARTGVPASPTVGRWPAFDPAGPRLVRLAPRSGTIAWPHFRDIALFDGAAVPPRPAGARLRD